MHSATTYLALGALAYMLLWTWKIVYRLFFHPLSAFPGPKLAAVSEIWYAKTWLGGRWPFEMDKMHRKYGSIVRTAPNELSFATVQSFQDIYGHASATKQRFDKGSWYDFGNPHPAIVGVRDPVEHKTQRKSLAHAFSAKAITNQQDVILQYTDLFVKQMGLLGEKHGAVDMSEAYNWLTFDIIGDLAFGEPFGAVADGRSNFWTSLILNSTFMGSIVSLTKRLPIVYALLPFVAPKNIKKDFEQHNALTKEKTSRRIAAGPATKRVDFFEHILKNEKNFDKDFLASQAETLIIAGSETTSTFLAGVTFYLLKNPDKLDRLRREVCSAFTSTEEINGEKTNDIPYLIAVIEEGLRLFPPAPFGLPRVSPGAIVDGFYIPAGVTVSTDIWRCAHSEENFFEAHSFLPERWLKDDRADSPFRGDVKEAFRPFSLGPRACLGTNLAYLEARIILAKLVYAYDWELTTPAVDWNRDCRLYLLWKKPELMVRFRERAVHP